MKLNKIVAVAASGAMAMALMPAVALAGAEQPNAMTTMDVASSSYATVYNYKIYADREAKYGTPPNGDSEDVGMSFIIELSMDNGVKITDAAAAVASLATEGNILVNNAAWGAIGKSTITTDGQTITIKVPVGMAIKEGHFASKAFVLNGVTVDGQAVQFPALNTVICTGLKFHTSSMTVGTATKPASTTITVDKSAVVRSMNHVVWTSNGTSIIDGTGTSQTTPAHHHTYYNFTTTTSATQIQTYAAADETISANYDVTTSGNTVTITAKTAKAGEYLGAYNYDDAFLQNAELKFTDKVKDLALAEVGMWEADIVFPTVTWSGTAKKPSVITRELNYSGYDDMTQGVDYKVTYSNNVKCGKGTAVVTGLGVYAAQSPVKLTFKIVPKTAKVKLKAAKKKITVKWAKTGATKYKVSYRAKGAKKWKNKTTKKVKLVLKKLKSGKKYQVKVTSLATGVKSVSRVKTVKVK